jgi:hypothetical protein
LLHLVINNSWMKQNLLITFSVFFLLAYRSGPAMGPTQSPIHCVPERLFPGGNFWEADNSPPPSAEVRMRGTLYPGFPYDFMEWCIRYRSNSFTVMIFWCIINQDNIQDFVLGLGLINAWTNNLLYVFMAMWVQIAVFWVVAPYSLLVVYRRFGGTCCLHFQPWRQRQHVPAKIQLKSKN